MEKTRNSSLPVTLLQESCYRVFKLNGQLQFFLYENVFTVNVLRLREKSMSFCVIRSHGVGRSSLHLTPIFLLNF